MKQVDIRTRTVPNRPRSGNYPTGSTVSVGGGGSSSTIINEGGGMDLAEARKHFLKPANISYPAQMMIRLPESSTSRKVCGYCPA